MCIELIQNSLWPSLLLLLLRMEKTQAACGE
jgi:hypothetical protein